MPSLAAGWLPGLLAGFRERHPGISIDLRDALLDPCLDMVRSGQADFAVASERPDMSELAIEFYTPTAISWCAVAIIHWLRWSRRDCATSRAIL